MNWFRKVVDEREELEIKRIESGAYYVFLSGLGIAIVVQAFMFESLLYVAGEFIILLAGAGWAMVGYFRKGIWDYRTKPGMKSYIGYSLFVTLVYGIIILVMRFLSGADILASLRFAAINSIVMFFALFLLFALLGTIIKWRRRKLEQEFDDAG